MPAISARASAGVLFIFQLPATIFVRIGQTIQSSCQSRHYRLALLKPQGGIRYRFSTVFRPFFDRFSTVSGRFSTASGQFLDSFSRPIALPIPFSTPIPMPTPKYAGYKELLACFYRAGSL